MRTIACESRAYVLSANQCVKRKHLPDWITGKVTASASPNEPQDAPATPPKLTKISTDDEAKDITERSTSVEVPNNHQMALPGSTSSHQPSIQALDPSEEEFVCRGGSCIVGPDGTVLAGPLWEEDEGGLLSVRVDFEDCERGRLDLDVTGSYGRGDVFRLEVDGLDINPPP